MLLTPGLVLVLGLGRGLGRGAGGAGGPSPLIAVQPPTKLYFCQIPETPEPLNKYIFYDTAITPEGKKCYLPGVSTVRYGTSSPGFDGFGDELTTCEHSKRGYTIIGGSQKRPTKGRDLKETV